MLTAQVHRLHPNLMLLQNPDDLLFTEPALLHGSSSLPHYERTPASTGSVFRGHVKETERKSFQETVTYARRIGSLARCVLSAEVLILRAVDGRLNLHDPITDISLGSLLWSCSSSIFQNLPF